MLAVYGLVSHDSDSYILTRSINPDLEMKTHPYLFYRRMIFQNLFRSPVRVISLLQIPGFNDNYSKNKNLVFARYKYRYSSADGGYRDGEFEILYSEIYNAISSLINNGSLYSYNSKDIRAVIDKIINTKKKQAYLLHYLSDNSNSEIINAINNSISHARTESIQDLFGHYIEYLQEEALKKIDLTAYRKALGRQKCYSCVYTIVNSKAIADNIVDYTSTAKLIGSKSNSEAFYKSSSQYSSVKRLQSTGNYIDGDSLYQIIGSDASDSISSVSEYGYCIKPIKLNNGKYIVIFVEHCFENEYQDEFIYERAKKDILLNKIQEIINAYQIKVTQLINVTDISPDLDDKTEIFSFDNKSVVFTIGDLKQMLVAANIDLSRLYSLPARYKEKMINTLLEMAKISFIKSYIAKEKDLASMFRDEFDGYMLSAWNSKSDDIFVDFCQSFVVGDEQLIDMYKDFVNQKKVTGYSIFCDNENIFNNVYMSIVKALEKEPEISKRQQMFMKIAADYTTAQNIDLNLSLIDLKNLSNRWTDINGNIVSVDNIESSQLYKANVSESGFIILWVKKIYSSDINNPSLLSDLRKKYIDDLQQQKLLQVSIISVSEN